MEGQLSSSKCKENHGTSGSSDTNGQSEKNQDNMSIPPNTTFSHRKRSGTQYVVPISGEFHDDANEQGRKCRRRLLSTQFNPQQLQQNWQNVGEIKTGNTANKEIVDNVLDKVCQLPPDQDVAAAYDELENNPDLLVPFATELVTWYIAEEGVPAEPQGVSTNEYIKKEPRPDHPQTTNHSSGFSQLTAHGPEYTHHRQIDAATHRGMYGVNPNIKNHGEQLGSWTGGSKLTGPIQSTGYYTQPFHLPVQHVAHPNLQANHPTRQANSYGVNPNIKNYGEQLESWTGGSKYTAPIQSTGYFTQPFCLPVQHAAHPTLQANHPTRQANSFTQKANYHVPPTSYHTPSRSHSMQQTNISTHPIGYRTQPTDHYSQASSHHTSRMSRVAYRTRPTTRTSNQTQFPSRYRAQAIGNQGQHGPGQTMMANMSMSIPLPQSSGFQRSTNFVRQTNMQSSNHTATIPGMMKQEPVGPGGKPRYAPSQVVMDYGLSNARQTG